ncbi:MAG: hypothetical protein HZB14_01180 [Actinobacteria bacterium]|nr:hypothetical protein [Actinomycetota bacterium]
MTDEPTNPIEPAGGEPAPGAGDTAEQPAAQPQAEPASDPPPQAEAATATTAAAGKTGKLQDSKMTVAAVAAAFVVVFALIAWTSANGDQASLSSSHGIPGHFAPQEQGGQMAQRRGTGDAEGGMGCPPPGVQRGQMQGRGWGSEDESGSDDDSDADDSGRSRNDGNQGQRQQGGPPIGGPMQSGPMQGDQGGPVTGAS